MHKSLNDLLFNQPLSFLFTFKQPFLSNASSQTWCTKASYLNVDIAFYCFFPTLTLFRIQKTQQKMDYCEKIHCLWLQLQVHSNWTIYWFSPSTHCHIYPIIWKSPHWLEQLWLRHKVWPCRRISILQHFYSTRLFWIFFKGMNLAMTCSSFSNLYSLVNWQQHQKHCCGNKK